MNCAKCGHPVEEERKFCGRCGAATENASARRSGGEEPTFVPVRVNDVLEGKWRLERKLGEGGMGTVYLAHDLQLDRKVAIKILASSLLGDSELVTRFEREARMTASLEHPNIVPVYAVGKLEDRPFIVMKKLEGRTLAAHLRECGAFSGDELVALMRQLCAGLDFIHARGFIHRDIKSGNIFIGPEGLATILDFGILRASDNAEALTKTGMVMGTPQYMSPEQALGTKEIDHRADLYALAILLFECLTGTLPFEAESELSLIQMQAHAPPPQVIDRAPWVPKLVSEVVNRALAKRPEERFGSAGELLAALEDAYAGKLPAPVEGRSEPLDPSRPPVPFAAAPAPGARGETFTQPSMKRASRQLPIAGPRVALPDSGRSLDTSELAHLVRRRRTPLIAVLALVPLFTVAWVFYGRTHLAAASKPTTADDPPPPAVAKPSLDGDARPADPEDKALRGATPGQAIDAGVLVANAVSNGSPSEVVEVRDEIRPPAEDRPHTSKRQSSLRRSMAHQSGSLNVVTTHRGEPFWASVLIDGVRRGNTPLNVELPPGKHRIRLERTGFRAVDRQIRVASGRSGVLRIELVP